MHVYSGSRTGHRHQENEDHFGSRRLNDGTVILAVADGIGAHAFGGSVARWLVKERILIDPIAATISEYLQYLQYLHAEFRHEFSDFEDMLHSGTTVSLVAIRGNDAEICWAGDSPVFHSQLRDGMATRRLTTPHAGITGGLTSCFSGYDTFSPDQIRITLEAGDILTVASDGISIDEISLAQEVSQPDFSQSTIDELLERSILPSDSDDATIICYTHAETAEHRLAPPSP